MARHEDGPDHDVERLEFAFDRASHEVLAQAEARVVDQQSDGARLAAKARADGLDALRRGQVGGQCLGPYSGDLPHPFSCLLEPCGVACDEDEVVAFGRRCQAISRPMPELAPVMSALPMLQA